MYILNAYKVPVSPVDLVSPGEKLSIWISSKGIQLMVTSVWFEVSNRERSSRMVSSWPLISVWSKRCHYHLGAYQSCTEGHA